MGVGAIVAQTPFGKLGTIAEADSETGAVRSLLDYVNPFVGVDNDGQTVPGAGLLFGFARVSPDTTDPARSTAPRAMTPKGRS